MSSFSPADRQSTQREQGLTETRSIDYIPDRERHGHPFSQFTLWFGGNLQITAIVTGALAVVLGGDVVWSLIGLLVGQVLGAAVMSLHALQGPRLGLPQMIISRAQFGVFGAVVPLVLVCVMYVGFSASGTVLAGQAMARLLSISDVAGMLLFSAIIIVIAVLGYRVIHKLGKVASVVGVLAFVYLFVTLLLSANLPAIAQNNHFSLPMFLLAVSLSSSWQIAFCPYVSDYSRYLPRNVSGAKTFLCVFSGTVLGTQASMTLGVLTAAIAGSAYSLRGADGGYLMRDCVVERAGVLKELHPFSALPAGVFRSVERHQSDRLLSDFRRRRGYSRALRSATALRILEHLRDCRLCGRRAYPAAVY